MSSNPFKVDGTETMFLTQRLMAIETKIADISKQAEGFPSVVVSTKLSYDDEEENCVV